MEFKQIFIGSSFKVFPQRKKKIFIEKSNDASMVLTTASVVDQEKNIIKQGVHTVGIKTLLILTL